MFEATVKAGIIHDFVVSVIGITPEVYINCGEEGMDIKAVDSAHVALATVSLDRKAFDHYDLKENAVIIGVNITKLKELLSLAPPGMLVTLKYLGADLNIKVGNVRKRIKVLSFDGKEPSSPNLELSTSFNLSTDRFTGALRGVETVSDHVILETKNDTVFVKGKNELDEIEARFEKDETELSGPDVRSIYSLDYIWKMAKSISGKNVRFELARNFPLRMSFAFGDGFGKAVFLVAPRLEA